MFGVSPAFTISLYTHRFTASQMAESLTLLPALGFTCYQPEIYRVEELAAWINGGAGEVAESGRRLGLRPSQFVAHFLLEYFGRRDLLASPAGIDEFSGVCEVCEAFEGLSVITLPLPAFRADRGSWSEAYAALIDKLGRIGEIAHAAGIAVALEVLPRSLLGGPAGVALLVGELSDLPFGYNLDTGHIWAGGDNPAWAAERLGHRVLGTHLCDNDGVVNDSLAPGRGTIDWHQVISSLGRIGYTGSFDIEIHTASDRVREEYHSARAFLAETLESAKTAGN